MKKIILLFLCGIIVSVSFAQTAITAADWQSDLKFLKETVHKDYSFLFKNVTAQKFNAEVETLNRSIPAMQTHEIIAGFGRIVSLFKYGHTDIGWSSPVVKSHIIPLNLYWFNDGIYVEAAQKNYADIVGARLIRIESVPVEKAMAAIKPLVPAENEQYFKAHGLNFLIVPEALHAQKITTTLKSSITLTLEKDGKTFDKKINAVDAFRLPRRYGFASKNEDWVSVRNQEVTPYYLKNLDKIYYYEYIADKKTLYVRHSQIQDEAQEAIPAFYKKVFDFIEKNDVERLVLDVRLNGGGNNYKNKPIVTGVIGCEKINKPGKFFVIIGRRTFSACQNLVNELHNYTNAVFVGEPTSENINFYGDNRRIELPKSKLPVFLSFAWWQDKPQWENAPWLSPQVAVEMSFDEYRTNRDPVLEACLNFSDKDLVLDPIGYLKELFMAGKMGEVESEAKRMATDSKYRYVDFESKINRAGYDLINQNQIEPAVFVMQLNTKLYPKSANAWDSFAEACWKAKKIDKAIECYNKAIELDPDSETGKNARNMLMQIKAEK